MSDGPYKVEVAEPIHHGFEIVRYTSDGRRLALGPVRDTEREARDACADVNLAFALGAQQAEAAAAGTIKQLQDELARARAAMSDALERMPGPMPPTRASEDGDEMEWSRSCRDWQHKGDKPRRLFVVIDDMSSGAQIYECAVTSDDETARPLRGVAGDDRRVIILTGEELRWLYAALGAALTEQAQRADGAPKSEPATEQALQAEAANGARAVEGLRRGGDGS